VLQSVTEDSDMTYRGHVKQGVIVLDSPAHLPEGTEVEVRASQPRSNDLSWGQSDTPDEEILVSGSVAGALSALPKEDFSDWENVQEAP
jgi:hypothetical protein